MSDAAIETPLEGSVTKSGDELVVPGEPFGGADWESAKLRRARVHSVILGAVLLLVALALSVSVAVSRRHPWFQPFDDWWRTQVTTHRNGVALDVARVLNVVGSVTVTLPLRIAAAIVLLVRRRWTQVAAFATAIATSEICVGLVKAWIDRPRPPHPLVVTSGTSFPSGHAIAAAVTAFGLVAAFFPRGRRRWHWIAGAATVAASMAWSRTYLSAHWATDTIAGTAIGVGIALLAEALFEGGRHVVAVEAAEKRE